ncbi:MAG: hypothetical protein KDC54_24625 [Lewinella sp.]|nr:hypothetical protein [Lewinella sp.]
MPILTINYGCIDEQRKQMVVIDVHQTQIRVRDLIREWLEMDTRRQGKVVWRTPYHTPSPGVTPARLQLAWQQFEARELFVMRDNHPVFGLDDTLKLAPQERIEILYRNPGARERASEAVRRPALVPPKLEEVALPLPQPALREHARIVALTADRPHVA